MLVCHMEVHDEVDRPHSVCEKSHQLDASAPLTLVVVHLCVLYLGGCVEEVHKLLYGPIVSLFDARVSSIGGNVVTEAQCQVRDSCSHRSRTAKP